MVPKAIHDDHRSETFSKGSSSETLSALENPIKKEGVSVFKNINTGLDTTTG